MLPEGAFREDYQGLPSIRKYAMTNAKLWYQYLVNDVGMDAYNGSLYVVTGFDKTNSYENFSCKNSELSRESAISVRFSSPDGNLAKLSMSYNSSTMDSPARRGSIANNMLKNLSVFIRGFKVMIRSRGSLFSRMLGDVKLVDMEEGSVKDLMRIGSPVATSSQSTDGPPSQVLSAGSSSMALAIGTLEEELEMTAGYTEMEVEDTWSDGSNTITQVSDI
jgi:hypothetical protein